jgi:hypothetical protein
MPEAALAEFKEVLIIADTKIAAAVNELLHRNDFQ